MHSQTLSIFINLILQNCSLKIRNIKKALSVISSAKYNEHTIPLLKEPNLLHRVHVANLMYKAILNHKYCIVNQSEFCSMCVTSSSPEKSKCNLLKRAYKM